MTEAGDGRLRVVVATPLEPELVEGVRGVDARLDVVFERELLPPPRYPGDHQGADAPARAPEDERRWRALLDSADVLLGLPGDDPEQLAATVARNPRLRWVQATAAGAGEQIAAAGLSPDDLGRVVFTSASGVHAVPLAEFCLFGILAFVRDLPRLDADKEARRWEHRPVGELGDRTLLVLGLGAIGREVARLARAFGMTVVGVTRSGRSMSPDVTDTISVDRLADALPRADAVVSSLPLTDETRALLDAKAIALLPAGAIVVNVGRGAVIDEPALVAALREGRVAGAALDVFATEPLPPESPLWTLPNVIVSPHTAALSVHENERIVALFSENLRRWLAGETLLSRVDPALAY